MTMITTNTKTRAKRVRPANDPQSDPKGCLISGPAPGSPSGRPCGVVMCAVSVMCDCVVCLCCGVVPKCG